MRRQFTFSGRQMAATLIGLGLIVVMVPAGAVAAGRTFVSIQDPRTNHRAGVTSSGQLKVTGPVSAKVHGQVTAAPAYPATPFTNGLSGQFTVPAGKHLVVETLSVQVDQTSGSGVEAFIHYTSHGVSAQLFMSPKFAYYESSTGYYFFADTESVRIYADPGTVVSVESYGGSGVTEGSAFMTVTGYLV